jgi:hypothetical protein
VLACQDLLQAHIDHGNARRHHLIGEHAQAHFHIATKSHFSFAQSSTDINARVG